MKKYFCVSDQKGNCYYSEEMDTLKEFLENEKEITSAKFDGDLQLSVKQLQEVSDGVFIKIEP